MAQTTRTKQKTSIRELDKIIQSEEGYKLDDLQPEKKTKVRYVQLRLPFK